ncbi:YihY family inner membrane protein [Xylophilus sp. Kf1]|nr:YihY family inner membrane protein [Xylophilus sp. Kf1]
MDFKRFFDLARKSVSAWSDDYAPSMGAAIAYYTVFSLAPLLLIVIAVAGAVFGRDAVQGEIVTQLQGLIGRDGALAIQGLIKSASKPADGLIAGAISLGVLLIGATTVFGELQSALDRIWQVPQKVKSGLMATLKTRVLSFGLILGLAFLLMVSLVVSAGVAVIGRWAGDIVPGWEIGLLLINLCISLGITTVLFAMIYKLMPQARIDWRDVWVGAGVTAVLFEVGKLLISLYVGKTSVASSYAAAGSIIVLLVWVYYSAQIFLLGAEFTWVFANEHGSRARLHSPATPAAAAAPAAIPQKSSADGDEHRERVEHASAAPTSGPTWQQKVLVYGTLTALQFAVRIAMGRSQARRRRRR